MLHGEPGIGKTALLDYLVESAEELTVLKASGVESEMELAYAGLHQLCAHLLDRLDQLPAPQREALEMVFGLREGSVPDRFLVGLAVLGLLAEAAERGPLLCVVDDAQWLDQTSALTLAFVARRLLAEPMGLVFAAREPGDQLQQVPHLEVGGLVTGDAEALLNSRVRFALDGRVRDRIIAETRGNPLALLELPRGLTPTQLAGGFGMPEAGDVSQRIEKTYIRRVARLPEDAQRLLLVAAADPVGDPLLLRRACERLGIALSAVEDTDGLLTIDERVTFLHPLARSAVYRSADGPERRAAHSALAEVTIRNVDPDRRAWHLAAAASEPDEEVAHELELSAGRASARGGLAAAAAFLQRAVALTVDPAQRAGRALAAAQASLGAGAFDVARGLLAAAEAGPLDELGARGWICWRPRSRSPRIAAVMLRSCCSGLQASSSRSTRRSREPRISTHGPQRCSPASWRVPAAACSTSHSQSPPHPHPRLPRFRATSFVGARAGLHRGASSRSTGAATCRWGVHGRRGHGGGDAPVRVPGVARGGLDLGLRPLSGDRHTRSRSRSRPGCARGPGRRGQRTRPGCRVGGDFPNAALAIAEVDAVKEATGTRIGPYAAIAVAGIRGQEAAASELLDDVIANATEGGQGTAVQYAHWARAVLRTASAAMRRHSRQPARPARTPQSCSSHRGHSASSSRPPPGPRTPSSHEMRSRASASTHAGATPIGGSGSTRDRARCSATAMPPTACTANPSAGWAARRFVRSSHAAISCTASGSGERVAGSMRAPSSAPPTSSSCRSEWRRSPTAPRWN